LGQSIAAEWGKTIARTHEHESAAARESARHAAGRTLELAEQIQEIARLKMGSRGRRGAERRHL
jgi:hypothetical protein